ncbi:Alpha-xylosidase [Fonsecaea erecta]|uniref:alpha-D-xyloside xylohydrolase n=1 Tax=Fonsecaea erecta TaxID=1367422 RepID=A0A178Z5G3_9EURO|nr:Alpha-xylosidase [Fonsecaea erecta]OAP54761.1 Alpha-xylosidase [Fonsecaea erecta]
MKFTEGMWRTRSGVCFNWMGNVERLRINNDDNAVDLLLTKPQRSRGDTLNAGTVSARLRTPLEGVIAASFSHWTGEEDRGPHFPLFEAPRKPKILSQERSLDYASGPLDLSVNTAPNELGFTYSCHSKKLTGHSVRSIAVVSCSDTPRYRIAEGMYAQADNYMLLELDLSVHEKIYGLGERFGAFVKNGQTVDVWNEDGGTSSELTYKNVPFYLSSRGYGVFINSPAKVMLEIQSERTTRVNIAVHAETLEYMVIAGPSPKEILDRYTALTGRPGLPPAWSYGLWLTTSFTTSYDEQTVTSFLEGFKEREIPLSVFHFDCFWMKSFQWCDFQFDDDNFPDAQGYLRRLKARGMKICVWINPYIAQASPLFLEGKKHGYFIMRADTPRPTVWQWDNWQAGMAVVDFTNPAARAWYASHLRRLMVMGVDSFKTDFGERIPFLPHQVTYHDGSDSVRMHNFYAYLYNKVVYEAMMDMQVPAAQPCLFARSATAGAQQFPVHWGGDCESTFEAMAETLRGGLSLALSGFAFWAHDIGGFEGLPDPALYKRWVQFGLLGSHSRLHGSSSYRVPWIYDGEKYPGEDAACSRVLKDSVERKLALMPYLLRAALEGHRRGTPVMRAMLLEFGGSDMNVWNIDTQYMLGADLLVAPVFDKDGEVTFYVPFSSSSRTDNTNTAGVEPTGQAKWRSFFDHGKTYEEGHWYTEVHGFDTLPLLVRPGAVVPLNPTLNAPDGDVTKGLQVLVNGPLHGEKVVELVEAGDVARVAKTFTVDEELVVKGIDGVRVVDMSRKA